MATTATPLDPRNLSLLWASPERAEEIAALHGRLFSPGWNAESVAASIEDPTSASFIAQLRDPMQIVGFVIGRIAADEAEIISIGVAPEWQRRGIAKRMLEGLARAARRSEVKRLFLEVAVDNEAALELYTGLGFVCVGGRKAYYERAGKPNVDAAILALDL
ncbi:ribosomal protein S18-alanine N-acetyltransferase [Hyphomicrobium sulfonivorans]|nr:ribosomal protein S18-alanine N-acetyltransferase [Hyphomicrobium sulfonivorans]MBI1651270.1 ribosomal protein S18-alanine N-acetyltransferase [Hyphomicrobium sulfonivorans]NSL73237.1 ribosomal-protein-alanine N-acetyltransferase [Hyphomicrobium sulfonivorans]